MGVDIPIPPVDPGMDTVPAKTKHEYISITACTPSCLSIRNPRYKPRGGDEPCAHVAASRVRHGAYKSKPNPNSSKFLLPSRAPVRLTDCHGLLAILFFSMPNIKQI